jgi:hypothetical protein
MTRSGIVGTASAFAVALMLAQPALSAQTPRTQAPAPDSKTPAAPKAQTPKSSDEKPAPLPPPGPSAPDKPQVATGTLGSVHVPHAVMANGQSLAAGTYTLRVSGDSVTPVTGQTVEESKWIEFVQGGQVKGKELATVVTQATAKQIADRGVPGAGSKVETLKGNDYLRVWVVKGNTSYLIHLQNAT